MSELYDTSETAEPASEAGAASWHQTSSGCESADNSHSDPDAAQHEAYAGESDYGSYNDVDLGAILAAEERLPESRTRQEAAADTWNDTTDDAAGSELATEYDGDLEALLAEEERLPESRTRQEAAAHTWDGTPDPGSDDPESFSGDPASEYDGDVDALLAEEEHLPEPRTRQEAAVGTWRDTASDQDADLDANTDSANLSQPDTITDSPTAPAQTDETEHDTLQLDTRQVAVHTQDGREGTSDEQSGLAAWYESLQTGGETASPEIGDRAGPDHRNPDDERDTDTEAIDTTVKQRENSRSDAAEKKASTIPSRHLFSAENMENIGYAGAWAGLGEVATHLIVDVPIGIGLGVAAVGVAAETTARVLKKRKG